jgi:NAD(P)-dependent dehydrogenase (short-subunit alcohol dehydrogenase family)
MKLLEERCAIVTGAGQGIGRAVAKGLAEQGANVVIGELNRETGLSAAEELLSKGGRAIAVETDVGSEDSVEKMVEAALRSFGRIDILVNNAAIFPASKVAEMESREWDEVLRTNLSGTFFCCRAVMAGFKKQNWGRIINFTSGRALQGSRHGAHYASSKAGIIGFTKSLALELAPYGVTVNAICPGLTDTAQSRAHSATLEEYYGKAKNIPLGRIGQPEDYIGPVAFLASDWAAYITGQTLIVNGGAF